MAQGNVTPINHAHASQTQGAPVRLPPETRTVEGRFYSMPSDDYPTTVVIDGVVYQRDRDQTRALLMTRGEDADAALLALVPEADRKRAAALLLESHNATSDWHAAYRDEIEAELVEMLPQHAPIIAHVFCPEDSPDIPINEAMRHKHCTLAPASSTSEEDAQ